MSLKIVIVIVLFLLVVMVISCAPRYYQGPLSDHFDGVRFYNPGKRMDNGLLEMLKWQWTSKSQPWPDYSQLPATDKPPQRVGGNLLRVSFVGHVTVLIQTQGLNILTDPIWSDRASPFTWNGPRRVHPPGISFEDLPPIDLILISHNHYDHLDLTTIERIWHRDHPRVITPLGNDTIIHGRIPEVTVEACDWSEKVLIDPKLTVYLEPMHHWSARGAFDRNHALWAAFVLVTPGGTIYFVGDSGYGGGDYFRDARKKYKKFRLAILPIGSYDPHWFMAYGHMNPEEAVRAFADLGQPYILPTHYCAFKLANTGYEEPLQDLKVAMQTVAIPAADRFRPLMAGEYWWVP